MLRNFYVRRSLKGKIHEIEKRGISVGKLISMLIEEVDIDKMPRHKLIPLMSPLGLMLECQRLEKSKKKRRK
jgi:hypothetical protein